MKSRQRIRFENILAEFYHSLLTVFLFKCSLILLKFKLSIIKFNHVFPRTFFKQILINFTLKQKIHNKEIRWEETI
jgi:hypothetical protein